MYVSDVNGDTSDKLLSTAYAIVNIEIPSKAFARRSIRRTSRQQILVLREAYCYISPKSTDNLPKQYCAGKSRSYQCGLQKDS